MSMRGVDEIDLRHENERLELATPEERLAFAVERYGKKTLFTSSFGAGSGVLLDLWSRVAGKLPVVFIDTGFLFDETLRYRDDLVARLGLTLHVVRPEISRDAFMAAHGDDIQRTNSDFCCGKNKVEPVATLKKDAEAWVSGIRRDQSPDRADVPILLAVDGEPLKVHPIATFTAKDVQDYLKTHAIPPHPLEAKGYRSIGCEPCTRSVRPWEDERAGRWAWSDKSECGLHTDALDRRKRTAS